MRIIDLSQTIVFDHVRWRAEASASETAAGSALIRVTTLKVSCHSFTHVDARRHYFPDGATIEATPLDAVVGPADVVDLADVVANQAIEPTLLAERMDHVQPGGKVILRTAWHRHRASTTAEFWLDAPYLTRAAALYLRERDVCTIAYDFPQDYCIRLLLKGEVRPVEEHVTHDILLRSGVHMIEYLTNTAEITAPRVFLSAAPLKIAGADGAPARVYAIEGA
jgi:arylformamidase